MPPLKNEMEPRGENYMPSSRGWDLSPDFCDSGTRLIKHCFPVPESLPKGHRFHFIYLIEVQLTYHVLVSGVQENDSVIHIYIFFFRFFSAIGYYKILNTLIVPCVGPCCLSFYISQFASASPKLPIHPSLLPPTPCNHRSVLHVRVCLFCR